VCRYLPIRPDVVGFHHKSLSSLLLSDLFVWVIKYIYKYVLPHYHYFNYNYFTFLLLIKQIDSKQMKLLAKVNISI
jgi:hypothetical protein